MPAELGNAILPALQQRDADHLRWIWTMATSEVLRHRSDKFCHFVRMDKIDVTDFANENDQKPNEYWASYAVRTRVPVHRETDSIILRGAKYKEPPDIGNQPKVETRHIHETAETEHARYYPKIMRYLNEFAGSMRSQLSRVIIARLAPRKQVYPHFDGGFYFLVRDRYHLVIRSPLGSKMRCMNDHCVFNEGELWWFNNNVYHEAFNDGDDWRIHIIFDLLPDHLVPLMEQIKQVTTYYQDQGRSSGSPHRTPPSRQTSSPVTVLRPARLRPAPRCRPHAGEPTAAYLTCAAFSPRPGQPSMRPGLPMRAIR